MRGAFWTAEEDRRLIACVKAGETSFQAAERFPGRSRNSIVGRSHRLGYAFGVGHVPGLIETHRAAERQRQRNRVADQDQSLGTDCWDHKLFEPYAHRKIRLVRERTRHG